MLTKGHQHYCHLTQNKQTESGLPGTACLSEIRSNQCHCSEGTLQICEIDHLPKMVWDAQCKVFYSRIIKQLLVCWTSGNKTHYYYNHFPFVLYFSIPPAVADSEGWVEFKMQEAQSNMIPSEVKYLKVCTPRVYAVYIISVSLIVQAKLFSWREVRFIKSQFSLSCEAYWVAFVKRINGSHFDVVINIATLWHDGQPHSGKGKWQKS